MMVIGGLVGAYSSNKILETLVLPPDKVGFKPLWPSEIAVFKLRLMLTFAFPDVVKLRPFLRLVLIWGVSLFVLLKWGLLSPMIGYLIGVPFLVAVKWQDFKPGIRQYRLTRLIAVAKRMTRHTTPNYASPILIRLMQKADPHLRIAAANGWMEMAPSEGYPALEILCADADPRVATAAAEARRAMAEAMVGTNALSVAELESRVLEYKTAKAKLKEEDSNTVLLRHSMDLLRPKIEATLYSQLQQRHGYPDLFCRNCWSRAERMQDVEWSWVRCQTCREARGLVAGVVAVIGVIGTEVEWILEGDILRIQLWNETTRQARIGEIDGLEIVGGQSVSYDWAVTAVLEKLRNARPENAPPLPLKMVDAPQLSVNTMHVIRTICEM